MQLSLNKIWACVFLLLALMTSILFFNWAVAAFGYLRLNAQTQGQVETFAVRQLDENVYAIEARYTYKVADKEYEDIKVLTNPLFLNRYAAQSHLDKYWKTQQWPVWYSCKHPEISSLQKLFPLKKFLSFFVSLSVFIYFFGLKRYVAKQEG